MAPTRNLLLLAAALSQINLGMAGKVERRQSTTTTTTDTTTLPITTLTTDPITTSTISVTLTSDSTTTTTDSSTTDTTTDSTTTTTDSSTTTTDSSTTVTVTDSSTTDSITSTTTSSSTTSSVTTSTTNAVDPSYTGNFFTLSTGDGPVGENTPESGSTRADLILRTTTQFTIDGFGRLVTTAGRVTYSSDGGTEQVFTDTKSAGGLSRRQTNLAPLTCDVLTSGVLECNGANGNVFYTDGVNLYLGSVVPAGFSPITIIAALIGTGTSTTSATITAAPTGSASAYWGNWVAATGSGVPVPLVTTIVIPGAYGPVTQTITVTSLHCGCTETPVPTTIVMTTYVTTCPDSWGYTAPVTVTIPAAPTSTPWGGADVYYECDDDDTDSATWSAIGGGSQTWSAVGGGKGGYSAAQTWSAYGGTGASATWSAISTKPTGGSSNGTSGVWNNWNNGPKYTGAASATGVSTALLALSGALVAIFA